MCYKELLFKITFKIYIYIPTLHAFFKMSYIKIKQKDIHKILVIFRLFTNIYIYIYIWISDWTGELVLTSICFIFDDRFKKQKEGTTIGTKFAAPYAIIFMAALEEEILDSLIKKPWLWWKYIDDIFMIWHHKENELKQFIDKLILEKESTF